MFEAVEDVLRLLINISVPVFAISSMLAMGLRTPLATFRAQLRDRRSMLAVMMANFVIVPAVGTLAVWMLDPVLPGFVGEGFVIVLCAAGAPFVLQLGAMARIPFAQSAGPMAVLLLGTVIYIPLVVPLLMRDVDVDGLAIAALLVGTMLAPMILGIVLADRYPVRAGTVANACGGIAGVSAVLMFFSGFGANSAFLAELLLSPAILVAVGIVVLSFLVGRIAGEQAGPTLSVSDGPAILTSQRNIAAALLAARGSDHADDLVTAVLLVSAVGFALLVPYALITGIVRRRRADEPVVLAQLIGIERPKVRKRHR